MASLWTKFTDIFSRNKSGVVPQAPSGTGTTKYLREDGTWAVPSGGGGGGSSTLADLEDVNLSSLSDGQNLSYNATSQKWENKTPSSGGHNYSTEEHIIGTWIDGKPIYEYTAHKTVNSTQDSLPAPANMDKLIDLEGFVIQPSGNMTKLNTYVSSTDDSHFYYSSSTGNIELRAGSSYGKGEWYITPRYTKTTDAPASIL